MNQSPCTITRHCPMAHTTLFGLSRTVSTALPLRFGEEADRMKELMQDVTRHVVAAFETWGDECSIPLLQHTRLKRYRHAACGVFEDRNTFSNYLASRIHKVNARCGLECASTLLT